jgi:hypothetical protein
VIGSQLVVVNTGPEKITLTNVTTDVANLLTEPTGLEAGGVALLPGERHQIMVTTDLSQPKHVDCDIEYIDDTGTRTRTVRLKVK